MLRLALRSLAVTTLICTTGCGTETEKSVSTRPGEKEAQVLTTRQDVKALFGTAHSWIETKHGDAEFIFCENILPTFGISRIDIHAWVFRRHSNQWESLFSIHTTGVGRMVFSIDADTGMFSATGAANNKFKNEAVFTFDLNATVF